MTARRRRSFRICPTFLFPSGGLYCSFWAFPPLRPEIAVCRWEDLVSVLVAVAPGDPPRICVQWRQLWRLRALRGWRLRLNVLLRRSGVLFKGVGAPNSARLFSAVVVEGGLSRGRGVCSAAADVDSAFDNTHMADRRTLF